MVENTGNMNVEQEETEINLVPTANDQQQTQTVAEEEPSEIDLFGKPKDIYTSNQNILLGSHELSKLYNEDPLGTLSRIETEGVRSLSQELNNEIDSKRRLASETRFNDLLRQNASLIEVEKAAKEKTQLENEQVAALSLLNARLGQIDPEGSLMSNTSQIIAARNDAARLAMQEYAEANFKSGFWATVGEGLDMFLSDTINNVASTVMDSGADRFITLGNRYRELLVDTTLSPEQFLSEFEGIMNEVADQGFLTEENEFIFNGGMAVIFEAGAYGEETESSQFWKYFDIATAVPVAKIGSVGKGLLLGTKGSEKAALVSDAVRVSGNKPVEKLAKFYDEVTAESYGVKVLEGSGKADEAATVGRASALNIGESNVRVYSEPKMQIKRLVETREEVRKIIDNNLNFGSALSKEQKVALTTKTLKELQENFTTYGNRKVLNYGVEYTEDGLVYGNLIIGKGNSTFYSTLEGAQKQAQKYQGEVVEVMSEGKVKYGVQIKQNVDSSKVIGEVDFSKIKEGLIASWFGSGAQTARAYSTILGQGESASGDAIKQTNKAFNKAKKALSKDEFNDLTLFEVHLDQSDIKELKGNYLPKSEVLRLYEGYASKPMTQKQYEMFQTSRDLMWERFKAEAKPKVEAAIRNDETMLILGDDAFRAKKTTTARLETDKVTKVWDNDNRQYINVEDISEGNIFDIHNAAYLVDGKKHKYVLTRTPLTRGIQMTDVMGIHYALPRVYRDDMKYFIKQSYNEVTEDGVEIDGLNTFMGVNTRKQAETAKKEINSIVDTIVRVGGDTIKAFTNKTDAYNYIKTSLGDNAEILKSIRNNNGWNSSLETIDDLVNFAQDAGIDLRNKIDYAEDGKPLSQEVNSFSNFTASSDTVGETFGKKIQSTGKKGNKILIGYGGDANELISPYDALTQKVTSAFVRKSSQAYVSKAGNEILNTIKNNPSLAKIGNPNANSLIEMVRSIEVTGTGEKAAKLKQLRDEVVRRAGYKDPLTNSFERKMRELSESFYDKGRIGLARKASKLAKDPFAWARGWAFDMKLGMFAPDQLWVQGSQVISASLITSGTLGITGTVKSAATFTPFVLGMLADTPEKLAYIAKGTAKFSGRSEEEFMDLIKWAKSTGRFTVDQSVAEGSGDVFQAMGMIDKVRQTGRMFFNAGEGTSRGMALILAHDEAIVKARKAGRKLDLTDQNVQEELFNRQDVLTARMTRASASKVQDGAASIPFQFLTYQFRMLEQVLLGGDLTKAERARLTIGLTMVYGTAGAPALGALSYATDKLFAESDADLSIDALGLEEQETYRLIKGGLMDFLVSNILNVDADVSSRLGIDRGMYDLWIKIVEDRDLFEVLGGPVGATGKDVISTVFDSIRKISNPDLTFRTEDITKAFRNFSSFDKGFKSYMVWKYGEYLSKKRGKLATDLSTYDAIATALGVGLEEVSIVWDAKKQSDRHRTHVSSIKKRVLELEDIWKKAVDAGDYEKAEQISSEQAIVMQTLDLDEQLSIQDSLFDSWVGMDEIIFNRVQKDLTTAEGSTTLMGRQYERMLMENKFGGQQ